MLSRKEIRDFFFQIKEEVGLLVQVAGDKAMDLSRLLTGGTSSWVLKIWGGV